MAIDGSGLRSHSKRAHSSCVRTGHYPPERRVFCNRSSDAENTPLLFSSPFGGSLRVTGTYVLSEMGAQCTHSACVARPRTTRSVLVGAYNLSQLGCAGSRSALAYSRDPSVARDQRGTTKRDPDALRTSSAEGSPERTTNFWAAVSAMADEFRILLFRRESRTHRLFSRPGV